MHSSILTWNVCAVCRRINLFDSNLLPKEKTHSWNALVVGFNSHSSALGNHLDDDATNPKHRNTCRQHSNCPSQSPFRI